MLSEVGIDINNNLRASWNPVFSGALKLSESGSRVCDIRLADNTTEISICSNGIVVDTTCLEIGAATLSISDDSELLAITDPGETFLDATAKKLVVGDFLEPDMPELLANLLGEVVVQLLTRRKMPQLSERLLISEPLFDRNEIETYVLSCVATPSRMTTMLHKGIIDSFEERSLKCIAGQSALQDVDILHTKNFVLPLLNPPPVRDSNLLPVILLDHRNEARQLLERKRRHALSPEASFVILQNNMLWLQTNEQKHELAEAPALPFAGNWYIEIQQNGSQIIGANLIEICLGGTTCSGNT